MRNNNLVADKSFQFGLRIIKLFQYLRNQQVERTLCTQLLRSGTSIGANIEEALGGSSKKDFIFKLQISYKEARETHYWLRLLKESEILKIKMAESFIMDCEELLKLLTAILKTSRTQ